MEVQDNNPSDSDSPVSSRDVSIGYSNIMNVSSSKDSVNLSNSSDIKKKTRDPRVQPAKLKDIIGGGEGIDEFGTFSHNPKIKPNLYEENSLPFSPSDKVIII